MKNDEIREQFMNKAKEAFSDNEVLQTNSNELCQL